MLETFKGKHGAPPKEFFIHGRTTFNDEEWNAFKKAAPKGTNVVGVRIKETHGESKLFRDGDYPVMRGTAIILDDRNALLWTNGFVPRLDTYIGPETPNPLSITVLRSTGETSSHSHCACRHHGPYQDQLQRLQLQRRTARHDSLCEQGGRRSDDGFGPRRGKAAAQVLRLARELGGKRCQEATPSPPDTMRKAILRLPDLDHAKTPVLNSLTCPEAQRGYRHAIDEFVDWYCSEPRLAFNKTGASGMCRCNAQGSWSSIHSPTASINPL